MQLVETTKIISAVVPWNASATAATACYVSMKNYNRLTMIITTGAWAAGTGAVSLLQATNVSAGGAKALVPTWQWTGTKASGALTKTAVVAGTFNLAAANMVHVMEIKADDLDVNGGFDCVTIVVATPGANIDLYSVVYVLSEPRDAGATPASAIID